MSRNGSSNISAKSDVDTMYLLLSVCSDSFRHSLYIKSIGEVSLNFTLLVEANMNNNSFRMEFILKLSICRHVELS